MLEITISPFDRDSVDEAIKQIDAYRKGMEAKKQLLLEKLADLGVSEARVLFTQAFYDGDNDVEVSVESVDNGFSVVASGEAVCFIEFGTGVYYNGSDSYPGERPAEVVGIGEYGQKRGSNEWWYYIGPGGTLSNVPDRAARGLKITHGNPASACLWKSFGLMRTKITEIAKEVFV